MNSARGSGCLRVLGDGVARASEVAGSGTNDFQIDLQGRNAVLADRLLYPSIFDSPLIVVIRFTDPFAYAVSPSSAHREQEARAFSALPDRLARSMLQWVHCGRRKAVSVDPSGHCFSLFVRPVQVLRLTIHFWAENCHSVRSGSQKASARCLSKPSKKSERAIKCRASRETYQLSLPR